MDDYDFILVNDEVDRCVEEMHALIQAMHARTENHETLIEKIKEYQKDKDYISAAKLINANPSIKQCMPDCADFNALNEEIRNAEIYAKTIKQSVFYMEDQPSAPNNSDVWIGGM